MTVVPQTALPVTIVDLDPLNPSVGTPENAASVMPNFVALRDGLNTHNHSIDDRAEYAGGAATQVSIASGASGLLPWVLGFGDALLDLTDPLNPLMVAAGVYAITSIVQQNDIVGARCFEAVLHLDSTNEDAISQVTTFIPAGLIVYPHATLTCTWYVPAGGKLFVQCWNFGAAASDFQLLETMIQRLS